jgi:hypothetical protein
MPSEYDILLPYSRALRRAGRALLLGGALVAGVACTALVIAIPFRHPGHDSSVSAVAVQSDRAAGPSATTKDDPGARPGPPDETARAAQPCEGQTWPNIDRRCLKSQLNLNPGEHKAPPPVRVVGPDKPADPTGNSAGVSGRDRTSNGSAIASDPPREPAGHAGQAVTAESAAKAPATEAAQYPAPTQTAQSPAPPPGAAKKAAREPPRGREASSHDKQNPTNERTANSEGTPATTGAAPAGEASVAASNENPPTATQTAGTNAPVPTSVETAAPRRGTDHRRAHRGNRSYAWRREYPGQSQPQNESQREQRGPTWTRGDDRDYGQEFVDAYGVRHIILPRRWSDSDRDVYNEPARTRRVIVVKPSEFDDEED